LWLIDGLLISIVNRLWLIDGLLISIVNRLWLIDGLLIPNKCNSEFPANMFGIARTAVVPGWIKFLLLDGWTEHFVLSL
jgi:hypothetical protein